MKIGVVLPNWIGDAVMATPALRALRSRYPDAEIVAVLRPVMTELLTGLDLVDRVLPWQPGGKQPEQTGWRFLRKLRAERLDWIVLFPNSFHSGVLAWLSGAKRRIGLNRDGRGWLLTDRVTGSPKKVPHPVIDEYLKIVAQLDCDTGSRRMELAVTPADQLRLQQFWNTQSVVPRQTLVCLNSGGAFGAAKLWPTAYFGELAARLARELNVSVLAVCGPAEREIAREIVRRGDHPHVFSLAETAPSLGLTKAAVASASLLVTTDSGPRHFAAAFGVPVVTLFGPTHIAWSETFYPQATHLQLAVDCGPCQRRTCPLGHHRCMNELTVEQVFQTVAEQLNTARRIEAA